MNRGPAVSGPRRFVVRNHAGKAIASARVMGNALLFASTVAKTSRRDVTISDERADVGDICLWIVRPTGAIEPTELRSAEPPAKGTA